MAGPLPFHHPVGRLPAGARWYLALLGMGGLLLLGFHFAAQVRAQDEAERSVHAWSRTHGIAVGQVRYRLLRNALELRDLHRSRPGESWWFDTVLVRIRPAQLVRKAPAPEALTVLGGRIHRQAIEADATDALLAGLLDRTRRLTLKEVVGEVVAGPERVPLSWRIGTLRLTRRDAGHAVGAGRGELAGGRWHLRLEGGRWHAELAGLNARAWLAAFGLGAPGSMRTLSAHLEGRVGGWRLEAMRWDLPDGAQLSLRRDGRAWAGSLERWPLASLGAPLAGMAWQAGRISAELQGSKDNWHLTRAELRGLRAPGLEAERLELDRLDLDRKRRMARAGRLFLHKVRLDPASIAVASGWRWHADRLEIRSCTLLWRQPGGELATPPLSGSASWKDGRMHLAMASGEAPNGPVGGDWRLKAEGRWNGRGLDEGRLELSARGLNLAPFSQAVSRAAGLAEATGLALDGKVDVRAEIHPGSEPSLDLVFSDARLGRGLAVMEWPEGRMRLVGDGRGRWRLDAFRVEGWSWLLPLVPLAPEPAQSAPGILDALARLADRWLEQAGTVRWQGGRISLGEPERVLAKSLSFELENASRAPAQPGRWRLSGVSADGRLEGTGRFALAGPRWEGTVRLDDALPFALHDWMRVSGMPRLLGGRLSASLSMRGLDAYRWRAELSITHGLFEPGLHPRDPFLALAGMHADAVLTSLPAAPRDPDTRRIRLEGRGDWSKAPWRSGMLRSALEAFLAGLPLAEHAPGWEVRERTGIRLHARSGLTHNERARLRRLWRAMLRNRGLRVVLVPRFAGEALTVGEIERIRHTQMLIEDFFRARGISGNRIIPVWPSTMHRAAGLGSVIVQLGRARPDLARR